jgi:hypothetical protein
MAHALAGLFLFFGRRLDLSGMVQSIGYGKLKKRGDPPHRDACRSDRRRP